MEIDLLKSSTATEDDMETMMMMQMEKLPEFYGACNYNDVAAEFSPPELAGGAAVSSPLIINQPTSGSKSFTGSTPVQEPSAGGARVFLSSPGSSTTNASWKSGGFSTISSSAQKKNSMAAMREIIFRIAAMQPIHIDPESVKPPKRRNVKISKDPQSVAARHRRERISERIKILQRLVPGGTKMDTASMLDEAIHYVKFLKTQVQSLERTAAVNRPSGIGFPVPIMSSGSGNYLSMGRPYQPAQNLQQFGDHA